MLATSAPRWRGDHASPFIFEMARHFLAEGVSVVLVVPRGPRDDGSPTPTRETWEGVEIRRFRYFLRRGEVVAYASGIPNNLRTRPVRTLALAPFFLAGFARAARAAARDCDLVHANWLLTAAVARTCCRGLPIVVTVHENNIAAMLRRRLLGRLFSRALDRVDAAVAPSPQQASALLDHGVPAGRVHVIPCGIRLPARVVEHRAGSARILWVGRVAPEKDVPTLLAAFRIVAQAEPQAHLTLVGDGPDLHRVRQGVAELGLEARVAIEGWRPPEDVAGYYARADVVAVSSLSEAGPIVVMEGMAHGLPVVSTPVGIVPTVVRHGHNGLLVPRRDAAAAAEAILSLVRDAELRRRLGAEARRTAEGLTWSHSARQYAELFRSVLRARRATPAPEAP